MVDAAKKLLTLSFGLMVVGALAFGTRQAVAASPAAMGCPYDGLTFLGSCTSEGHCWSLCFAVHGDDLINAVCGPAGCCRCWY